MQAYWSQFSHAEIMSMHGVEVDEVDYDTDSYHDDVDTDLSQEEEGCCSGCMDCLGLSWSDFM